MLCLTYRQGHHYHSFTLAPQEFAAYFTADLESLRWLAYAATMMFFVRGPSLYVRDFVAPHPDERSRDVGGRAPRYCNPNLYSLNG